MEETHSMSAVEALRVARAVGIQLEIDGEDLVLQAPAPPPPAVVEALTHHKAEIVALLRPAKDGWSAEDWQLFFDERAGIFEFDGGIPRAAAEAKAFEACVIEWLNRNPAPSPAGRCAWCAQLESDSASIVPFGTEPGTHAWLHGECWRPWQEARRAEAVAALSRIGSPQTAAPSERP
jgi:hypothetical protein